MDTNNKNILKSWPVFVVFGLLAVAIGWVLTSDGMNNTYSAPINGGPGGIEDHSGHDHAGQPHGAYTLETIVKYARTWGSTMEQWHGKAAPELVFADIEGKTHKLSEYAGKDVLLLFWATWCPPCKAEIPELIELRNLKSSDELAIIAISDEDRGLVKKFAAANNLNYTVGSLTAAAAKPFSDVRALPTAFYIDKEGKIKFAVEGAVSMAETLAIFEAEK